jgi:hypothetical protein
VPTISLFRVLKISFLYKSTKGRSINGNRFTFLTNSGRAAVGQFNVNSSIIPYLNMTDILCSITAGLAVALKVIDTGCITGF